MGFSGPASDPDLPHFLGLDVNAASEQGDCSISLQNIHSSLGKLLREQEKAELTSS